MSLEATVAETSSKARAAGAAVDGDSNVVRANAAIVAQQRRDDYYNYGYGYAPGYYYGGGPYYYGRPYYGRRYYYRPY
jgi:hypothetical protein